MPNYTFKWVVYSLMYTMTQLFCGSSDAMTAGFFSMKIRPAGMSYVLASTLRMDCARAMNNSVSLTSLVEVI